MAVNVSNHTDVLINRYLKTPVNDFLARPRKDLRGEIIKVGHDMFANEAPCEKNLKNLEILSSILEWIHAGSLIIDDIQDDSLERRGDICLHRKFGVPCALNAANWMYFESLKKFNEMTITEDQKFKMMNLSLEVMALAHQGQAIDIMTDVKTISKEDIYHIGQNNQDLKSGMLFSLALSLGALLANPQADLTRISEIGVLIGRSLQRFDDLGNLVIDNSSKALEDLALSRPTWPWMYLSKFHNDQELTNFKNAVNNLPDTSFLQTFLNSTNLRNDAISHAKELHEEIYQLLNDPFPGKMQEEGVANLKNILQRISHAYI